MQMKSEWTSSGSGISAAYGPEAPHSSASVRDSMVLPATISGLNGTALCHGRTRQSLGEKSLRLGTRKHAYPHCIYVSTRLKPRKSPPPLTTLPD